MEKPDFRYEQETQVDRLARKSKEMPIFPLGKYKLELCNLYSNLTYKYQVIKWKMFISELKHTYLIDL